MVLAVVDDLLFSSKIRAVADRAGQTVAFARSRDAVLPEILAKMPHVVIIDLDRATLDPMATIRDIKARPELDAIRVVGFVSHVHADTIEAARDAGIDLVLARSAFVAKLPELVAGPGARVAGTEP
jgi:DNA-binding NarL/FixJ family response regulator